MLAVRVAAPDPREGRVDGGEVKRLGDTHAGSRGGLGLVVARMILGSKAGGRIVFVAGPVYDLGVINGGLIAEDGG